ncbi:MAG: efflux RND transporter periplasmic adaptor subunit [Terracidiphilus sp.]|jgi:RND family efflux transporter MFP subunit
MISPLNDTAVEAAALLLAAPDAASRAAVIASAVVELIPDSGCVVYRLLPAEVDGTWSAIASAGEIAVEQGSLATDFRLLLPLLSEAPEAVIYPGAELRREDYSHLHVTRSVISVAYVPLVHDGRLTGAIEILTFSALVERQQFEELAPIVRLASPAILAAEDMEEQRQTLLDSVHRMSQLYDLEKSLNSTLEFDAVIVMIPEKALAMLPCQAIHLWLFEGTVLRLLSSQGADATVELGMMQAAGEGYVADMAEEGEPLLIDDPDDERLSRRNAAAAGSDIPPVTNALLVPLIQDEAEVGVLEAINREGHPFDEDDLFFLSSMAETVSSALKNASLMLSERKLEILEALVRVSSEITSTLRLDRLLQIIVNSPQNVLPYEQCAIALDNRGRLQLKAVSGMASLPMGDVQVERLQELLHWLSSQEDLMYLRQHEQSAAEAKPDLPPPVTRYFEETGSRGLYSLPLNDDQGRVGLLLYVSSDPDFLELPHTEMIKVLAGQATVAIRNALLYREVPLISLIEPLIRKRAALLRTSLSRRLTIAAVAAAVVLFLIFCPLPMRVAGDATVAPQHLVTVAAPVEGNVEAVFAHEGQRVAAGDVLGALNDWQWRTELTAAEAKYQQAELTMENDLAHGAAQAGADRTQAEYLRSEVARARTRLDSAQLRSPIAGIVVTPNLQNAAGQHLDAGAPFAQVLDLDSAVFQIAIPQRDADLLDPGQAAAIKLDSYPQRTWRSKVSVVGPAAQAGEGDRTFTVEVPMQNADAILRAGMTGRAKIYIGWRPAGYVLLRRPALWIWQTLWNWIGW